MKVEIKEISGVKRDIKIEVDKDSLKEIRTKILDRINKEVSLHGFRKGKAPIDLIEMRHPNLVRDELLKEAVPFYYQKALEEKGLEVVSVPDIKDAQYSQDGLSFMARVEIKPQINIDQNWYKQIKLKVPLLEVDEKEIVKFIAQLKDNVAENLGRKAEDIDAGLISAWAGYKDFEEFRKAIYSELYISKVIQRRRSLEREITQAILSKVKCDLPESVLAQQKNHLVQQEMLNLHSRGVSEEDLKKHSEEIAKKSEALAKEQVKLYYILDEIAKKEKLNCKKDNLYEVVLGFILSNILTKQ
ncbi:MAG: hypothetical protein JW734_06305 [Candidatus Omnitrophica bacterium]|nr:hypothetical protein [Candidatus Omnitrophota bacterium]